MSPSSFRRSTITWSEVQSTQNRRIDILERDGGAIDEQAPEAFPPQGRQRFGHRVHELGKRLLGRGRVLDRLLLGVFLLDFPGDRVRHHGHHRHLEPDQKTRAGRKLSQPAGDDLGRLTDHLASTAPAERPTHPGVEQPQVIVNLRRRADRRAGVSDAVFLTDGDRGTDALDALDVRLFHPFEELPGIGR